MNSLIERFSEYLLENYPYLCDEVLSEEKSSFTHLAGFNPGAKIFFISALWNTVKQKSSPESLLVVLPNNSLAEGFASELEAFIPKKNICIFEQKMLDYLLSNN